VNQSEYLNATELHELTGYARQKRQAAWLRAEGIPHQVRGRRVIVCRVHSRQWVEGRPGAAVSFEEPDLSCVT
jgi:hypothetical protein